MAYAWSECPTHWTCDEIIEPRNGLIIAIIRHTRLNFGTELVQEDHSQTFFQSSLGKLNNALAYANYSLFLIILVGYCSGKHTVIYGTIGA